MKLPHVTIEYREEETDALGKMSLSLIIGFGLHWAWVYLVMYNGYVFFGADKDSYASVFAVSLCVFALMLLGYGVFFKSVRQLLITAKRRKVVRLVAALCMSFSTFLMYASFAFGDVFSVAIVGGVVSGFGSAVLLMSFGVSFSVCDVAVSSVSAAFSFLLAALTFVLVLLLASYSPLAGVTLCSVIPLVEVICLSHCSSKLVDNLEFQACTIDVRIVPFALRLCVPCLLMGVMLGFVRAGSFSSGGDSIVGESAFSVCLAGLFSCTMALFAMLAQRKTLHFMFRTLVPVAAIMLLILATPLGKSGAMLAFASFSVCFMLEMCMWVLLADISQRYRISAFTVFGFGRGALALGTFVSLWTSPFEAIEKGFPTGSVESVVLVSLVLLILANSLLPTASEIRSTLCRGYRCPAFGDGADATLLDMGDGVGEVTANRPCEPDELSCADGLSFEKPSEEKDEFSSVTVAEGSHGEESAREAGGVSSHKRSEADGFSSASMGRFKRKCLATADAFLLSRKETEVLFLLAKGRNSSAIQELLYISAGTTNTHMRNIYRKLGVHSQQELIRLVESMDD